MKKSDAHVISDTEDDLLNSISAHLKVEPIRPPRPDSDLDLSSDDQTAVLLYGNHDTTTHDRHVASFAQDYYGDNNEESSQSLLQSQERRTDSDLDIEIDFAVQLTKDRNTRIQKVAEGTNIMYSMMTGLHKLVMQNSEMIDSIEDNVIEVREDAISATEMIGKADEYLRAKRQRMCYLALCMSMSIIVFVLLLSIAVK